MTSQTIQQTIAQRLTQGEGRSAVFQALSGQGVSDRKLANLIAAFPLPSLVAAHAGAIKTMVGLAWVQCLLSVGVVLVLGLRMGSLAALLLGVFVGGITYLFVWGFQRHKLWAYNATILLTAINLPKALKDVTTEPISTCIAVALSLALIAFTWHVRSRLFPDVAAWGPRRVGGTYVFAS